MKTHIVVESPVEDTPRVQQVRGMFDLAPEATSRVEWDVDLPLEEKPWNVGLIVGPSGCGKSTIARRLWPEESARQTRASWSSGRAILDDFPGALGVKEVVGLLSSVGFSSPPAWLRPFSVLSTGQQFRVTLARLLAEAAADPDQHVRGDTPIVFDEFTSVVDRTVAQIGSHALQKAVRSRGLMFVALTCHEDVEPWLNPDWVYRPAEQRFAWRSLRQRPGITLYVVRVEASAWPLFAQHHYLSGDLHQSAVCFVAYVRGEGGPFAREEPVAFSAWLPLVRGGGMPARREHRTVCLPDYQGAGIGNALSDTVAAMWKALGWHATSTTTHPAMIAARRRSPHWVMTRAPGLAPRNSKAIPHATTRLTAGFRYVGPAMNRTLARMLLGS